MGRFVAPGAVGIFLGPRLSKILWLRRFCLPGILLILAVLLLLQGSDLRKRVPKQTFSLPRLAGILGCMFVTVFLRSYMGTVLNYPFLAHHAGALCFTLCIFLGKFFGGSLADRFGALPFSAAAQAICVILFTFSPKVPWLAFPGIFRGTFDVRASDINEEMKMAAAKALAELISDEELSADYIIPKAFDPKVGPAVAAAVAEAARESGVARI